MASVVVEHWERSSEHISVTGIVDNAPAAAVIKLVQVQALVDAYDRESTKNWPKLKLTLAKALAQAIRPSVSHRPDAIEI